MKRREHQFELKSNNIVGKKGAENPIFYISRKVEKIITSSFFCSSSMILISNWGGYLGDAGLGQPLHFAL